MSVVARASAAARAVGGWRSPDLEGLNHSGGPLQQLALICHAIV